MLSSLLINDVPIECINQAAITYHVPAEVIISVLKVEGGRAGTASPNKNGTYDYGPMQINSIWAKTLAPHGYTLEQIRNDPCVNVWVGTWILSQKIAQSSNLWRGIANYHSYTTDKNIVYQGKVWNIYQLLHTFLSQPEQPTTRQNSAVSLSSTSS